MNASQIHYPRLRSFLRNTLLVLLLLAATIGLGKAFQYTHWSGFVPEETPTRGAKSYANDGPAGRCGHAHSALCGRLPKVRR